MITEARLMSWVKKGNSLGSSQNNEAGNNVCIDCLKGSLLSSVVSDSGTYSRQVSGPEEAGDVKKEA